MAPLFDPSSAPNRFEAGGVGIGSVVAGGYPIIGKNLVLWLISNVIQDGKDIFFYRKQRMRA
jgi:hypothetical protein